MEETGLQQDIWSHSWSFSGAGLGVYTTSTADPAHPGQKIKIDKYIIMPETSRWSGGGSITSGIVGIGVFCHEFGHALGLPDLYDTGGAGAGLGNASLMAGGGWGGNGSDSRYPAHLDAWSKADLGWLAPTTVTANGNYSVKSIETNQSCYRLKPLGSTATQYFLIENRQHTGFDKTLFDTGIFIYHIDESIIASYRGSNTINVNTHAYGVALEEADINTDSYSAMHLFTSAVRGWPGDAWPNTTRARTAFSEKSIPSTKLNSGAVQDCGITGMPAKSDAMSVYMYVTAGATTGTPIAQNGTLTITEGTAASGTLKATDPGGLALTYRIITNGARGTAVMGNTTYACPSASNRVADGRSSANPSSEASEASNQ
jgi:hypothetical protein